MGAAALELRAAEYLSMAVNYNGLWDAGTLIAPATLNGGDDIVSIPGGSTDTVCGVLSTPSLSASGLQFFSLVFPDTGNFFFSVGLVNAAFNRAGSDPIGFDPGGNSLGQYFFGEAAGPYIAGNLLGGSVTSAAPGATWDMAVDFDLQLVWLSGDARATWNSDPSANPCTGAGGYSIAGLGAGPFFVAVWAIDFIGLVTAQILSPAGDPCPVPPPPPPPPLPPSTTVRFLVCGPSTWTITQPTSLVYGLDHLAGATVYGLADGILVGPLVVTADGAVQLPFAASAITLGLAFTPQTQTTYLDAGSPTVQGRRKNILAVTARVQASQGVQVGTNQPDGSVVQPNQTAPPWTGMQDDPAMNGATYLSPSGQVVHQLVTGDLRAPVLAEWAVPGQVAVQGTPGLPLNLLAVVPELLEGDTIEQTYSQKGQSGEDRPKRGERPVPGNWMIERG